MKKIFILSIVFGFLVFVAAPGSLDASPQRCCSETTVAFAKDGAAKASCAAELCGKCGELKKTKKCCKKDAVKCSKCDLSKGSPGCCKITKGKDAKLCGKCGEIKGTKTCCSKSAPACCKIKPAKTVKK